MAKKREGYLEWDEYFMGVAFLAAQRSKDPSTQVRLLHDVIEKGPAFRKFIID